MFEVQNAIISLGFKLCEWCRREGSACEYFLTATNRKFCGRFEIVELDCGIDCAECPVQCGGWS